MRTFHRYLLLQVPGWALAVVVLYLVHRWLGLPLWAAGLLLAADVVKDLVLYPWLRRAYEDEYVPPAARLAGETAEVVEDLAPEGYVRVRGELWRARCGGGEPVASGGRVQVTGAQGTVLIVEPRTEESGRAAGGQQRRR